MSLRYIHSMFEDPNGDPDELTLVGAIALLVLCVAAGAEIWHGRPVNLQDFGVGASAIIVAVGGGKRARDGALTKSGDQ
jgi:hypothetical protein